jgi:hypothetical protein
MASLIEDLQTNHSTIDECVQVALRVLHYLPSVVSERRESRGYKILVSRHAGTEKYARPIRLDLFIADPTELENSANAFKTILTNIADNKALPENASQVIDKVAYTIQQCFGVGLDFLGESNSNRKHIGNRFEELIRIIVTSIGITNDRIVFKIPYPTDEGEKMYSCETDMVLSGSESIQSNPTNIAEEEIMVSLKTSSKDRMGKIFLDKMLMKKFSGHRVKVVGIFHNDVQRKEENHVSFTLVSRLFMVYTKFLCELDGVYFLDPPPITEKEPYCQHIAPFSKFLLHDAKALLSA